MAHQVYFDNSATTPLDPRVAEAMAPCLGAVYGNPSSLHWAGRAAREAVDRARAQVAALLNAKPEEIVFTGGGSEAVNLALKGVLEWFGPRLNHVIVSRVEHQAVLNTCKYLEARGAAVTRLPVNDEGLVDPAELARAIRPETKLVSIMTASNIVGALQPIRELAQIAHQRGVLFHTDAVQAAGKIPLDVRDLGVDLLSLSAHKMHGPKGMGALFVREGVLLEPLIHGGGQERDRRSGTENVAGIVGFGCAAELARQGLVGEMQRLVALRDRLIDGMTARIPNAYLLGPRRRRLPGHVSLGFAGQENEAIRLLLALDEMGYAVSSGSACSSNHASEPSYVLLAMGLDPVRARGSLRVTLGRFNTENEVDDFLNDLPQAVASLRPLTSRAAGQLRATRSAP